MVPGVEAVVSPTSDFYVNDYANILNAETKQYIMEANIDLNKKTKAQVCVVTVESLEGKTVEEYATETFRNFGIGDKQQNNGVLILVSTGDRKIRIEVGYGLEGKLTDARTGTILDTYAVPYLKNNNWNEGIRNTFNAVIVELEGYYGIDVVNVKITNNAVNNNEITFKDILPGVFACGIVIWILIIVFINTIINYYYIKKKIDKEEMGTRTVIRLFIVAVELTITSIATLIEESVTNESFLPIYYILIGVGVAALLSIFGISLNSGIFGGGGGWSSDGGRRRLFWRRWFIRWWWIIKIILI